MLGSIDLVTGHLTSHMMFGMVAVALHRCLLCLQARNQATNEQASKAGSYFGSNVDKMDDLPPLPKADKATSELCATNPTSKHHAVVLETQKQLSFAGSWSGCCQ